MNIVTSPSRIDFYADASLSDLLYALVNHPDKPLVIKYGGRTVQAGYHVTEVKAGSFVTLDCGGNPDQWHETILQVEDRASEEGRTYMSVSKFSNILAQVANRIELDAAARMTFEVGTPTVPMRIFDVNNLQIEDERVVMNLASRTAICKPRHRAAQEAAKSFCCGPSGKQASCCS